MFAGVPLAPSCAVAQPSAASSTAAATMMRAIESCQTKLNSCTEAWCWHVAQLTACVELSCRLELELRNPCHFCITQTTRKQDPARQWKNPATT